MSTFEGDRSLSKIVGGSGSDLSASVSASISERIFLEIGSLGPQLCRVNVDIFSIGMLRSNERFSCAICLMMMSLLFIKKHYKCQFAVNG